MYTHIYIYMYLLPGVAFAPPLNAEAEYAELQEHRLQHASACVSIRQHASAYVSIRQHTSAYVSIRQLNAKSTGRTASEVSVFVLLHK
jgi:hypothetical protein